MPQLVALQAMLPQIDSPVELQTKALQLRQLQAAGMAAEAEAQARQQALADDKGVRAAYAANPTDAGARLNALAGVSPKAYATEATQQASLGKSRAETEKSKLALAKEQIDIAGQAFGYVRKNPTPENAMSAIKWLTDKGVYTPEQAAEYSAQVQANPANVQMLAESAFTSAMDVKDQLLKIEMRDTGGSVQTVGTDPLTGKTTTLSTLAKTQTPDNIASNNVRVSEGAKDRAAQIQAARVRAEAAGGGAGAEPSFDAATLELMAEQALRGDKSVYTNIGRGAQGSANLVALRKRITALAGEQGISGAEIAARNGDFAGQLAGLRTANTISARVENAAAEAAELAPLALAASKEVARSGFLPFGKAQVLFDTNVNDPALKKFATANLGLATAYAGAMARGGKATVEDNKHARELLSTATSQKAYEAAVSQLQLEIKAAQRAPQVVREHLRGEIKGKSHGKGHTTEPNPFSQAGAIPTGWDVKEVR